MIHVNFNSGGIGSRTAALRIILENGIGNVINLFTDTLIEDRDLYRFLIETNADFYGVDRPVELLKRCEEIPDVESEDDVAVRKRLLAEISAETMRLIPGLVWIADGRTPWEVFKDVRFLGNSRIAQCSHILKQEMSRKWVEANFKPEECTLYLGIDWSEINRTKAPTVNWAPYTVKFPMCDEPYVDKADMLAMLDEVGIARPRLYDFGFAHNNCGSFCVRAGQGHFAKVLEVFPRQFAYHEQKEHEMREFLGKDVTVLKREGPRVNGKRTSIPLTFKQLRERIEGNREIDRDDIGGCGCFVTDNDKEAAV